MRLLVPPSQLKIFYAVSVLLLVVDQLTKLWAYDSLRGELSQSFMGDMFRLEYAENPGAFLGMGNSLSDPVRFWVFTIFVSALMLGLGIYMHVKQLIPKEAWAYSLIFAGGVGNLIDRIFHEDGHVIDFLNAGIGSLRTGIFNVADMAIMLGLFILLFSGNTKSKKV